MIVKFEKARSALIDGKRMYRLASKVSSALFRLSMYTHALILYTNDRDKKILELQLLTISLPKSDSERLECTR